MNLENIVNHRDNVLNRLISGNVRHQVQECPRALRHMQTKQRSQ